MGYTEGNTQGYTREEYEADLKGQKEMMDYEEALLQVTDVLKTNNRYRLGDFEQAVKLIRDIVTPKGKWEYTCTLPIIRKCSICGVEQNGEVTIYDNYCPYCGADMRDQRRIMR